MTDTMDQIVSKGYWKIRILPSEYKEQRLPNLQACRDAVRDASVSVRGWPFPMFQEDAVNNGNGYVQGEIEFKEIREFWRYYKSGQFVYYLGLPADWSQDVDPGEVQSFEDIVGRVTEAYLFARNLAEAELLGSQARIEIELHNMENRSLLRSGGILGNLGFRAHYKCAVPSIITEREVSSANLVTDVLDESFDHIRDVLELYNWKTHSDELITNVIEELFPHLVD